MHDDSDFRYSTMTPVAGEARDGSKNVTYDPDRQGSVTPSSSVVDDLKYHLHDDSQDFSDVWSPAPSEFAKDQYKYRTNVNGSDSFRRQVKFTDADLVWSASLVLDVYRYFEERYYLRFGGGLRDLRKCIKFLYWYSS